MRKFLLPIINLVNIILVSIAWGISKPSAVLNGDGTGCGNWYQLIFGANQHNIVGIVGFALFVAACALMLVNFLPIKGRKVLTAGAGALFISAGILMLKTPAAANQVYKGGMELSGSFIAMAVLIFVAGALSLLMSVIEITAKKGE